MEDFHHVKCIGKTGVVRVNRPPKSFPWTLKAMRTTRAGGGAHCLDRPSHPAQGFRTRFRWPKVKKRPSCFGRHEQKSGRKTKGLIPKVNQPVPALSHYESRGKKPMGRPNSKTTHKERQKWSSKQLRDGSTAITFQKSWLPPKKAPQKNQGIDTQGEFTRPNSFAL